MFRRYVCPLCNGYHIESSDGDLDEIVQLNDDEYELPAQFDTVYCWDCDEYVAIKRKVVEEDDLPI